MTFLVERLADLRQHLGHLHEIAPRVRDADALRRDLSLHNDVLFSLLVVCQAVIAIAGELAGRRGVRFDDYRGAMRALGTIPEFPPEVVRELETLPGFRNVLIHEYVQLDYGRVVEALRHLDPIERFAAIVARIEAQD